MLSSLSLSSTMSESCASNLESIIVSGKDGNVDSELVLEFLSPASQSKALLTYTSKQKKKKNTISVTTKMSQPRKANNKVKKNNESQNPCVKQPNGKQDDGVKPDPASLTSWVCKNAACRASLPKDDTFCRRCSCCICHKFDENKDPSLWLVCEPEQSGEADFCGLSCHLECAFLQDHVGVFSIGKVMSLDGNYCCYSCGKISGVLRCWKRQLVAAKDARRIDVLCYRIYLSYRLLEGTSRFNELHEIIKAAKSKLEDEVGPLDGNSAKMARGIVSRLPVASEVQDLCITAIKMADDLLANASTMIVMARDSLPAACKFQFEEITPKSVTFHLVELPRRTSHDVTGYKLWCCKSGGETPGEVPFRQFPVNQRRMKISNLRPCTEYTFRVISYTEAGDLGHSHAMCFTGSIEIMQRNHDISANRRKQGRTAVGDQSSNQNGQCDVSSKFKISHFAKLMHLAEAQEEGLLEAFYSVDTEKNTGTEELRSRPHEFDLNTVSVPDLNEEFTPPRGSSGGEDNGVPLELPTEADEDDDAASNGVQKNNGLLRSDGSNASLRTDEEDVPELDFLLTRKRKSNPSEAHECDSALVKKGLREDLDEDLVKCVKMIRRLECEGHIEQEFRLKFLTWFSLRSTVVERRVVNSFIQNLEDEPSSLADQLRDSFSDIISTKCPIN